MVLPQYGVHILAGNTFEVINYALDCSVYEESIKLELFHLLIKAPKSVKKRLFVRSQSL